MKSGKKPNPVPIQSMGAEIADQQEAGGQELWHRYIEEPIVRFRGLLKVAQVGRSKAYELMNPKHPKFDPEFPAGFPLFDSPRSPKAWFRHEVIAWVEGRANKQRKFQEGNEA